MSSWFGSKKEETPPPPPSYESSFGGGGTSSDFTPAQPLGTSQAAMQQAIMQEQQIAQMSVMMQQLGGIAWDTCILGKPAAALTSTEKQCVASAVVSFLDTSQFVQGRLMSTNEQH